MSYQQKLMNDFKRDYLAPYYRTDWNKINISKADSYEHNLMVCKICLHLLYNDTPFLTQATFKSGLRPDIVVPFGLPKKILEVRASETEDRSIEKFSRIPEELHEEVLYVDAYEEFRPELLQ